MSMLAAALAIVAASTAADLSGLHLSVTTKRPTLLAGEPTRVDVKWTATAPVMIAKDQLRIVLGAPDAPPQEWGEATLGFSCGISMGRTMEPGESFVTTHVLGASGRMHFSGLLSSRSEIELAFPKPGAYRVQARYATVSSDWLEIKVVAPRGEDVEAYEVVRASPWIVTPYVELMQPVGFEDLLRRHPRSSYFARTRLLLWQRKAQQAYEDAPEQPGVVPFTGNVPAVLKEIATTPLPEPFDEDRLILLAESAEGTAHREIALAAWRELLQKFPDGAGAETARRRTGVAAQRRPPPGGG